MTKYKLTYFDLKGRGEPIRYILSYMGKKFEDVRIQRDKWPPIKKTFPFGRIPTLEIDGKVFHQTAAICRYLAIEAGLAGKSPLENFEIDQVVGAIDDMVGEIGRVRRTEDPVLQQQLKETLINEIVPRYLERFEKIVENNGGYLANGRLSWADLYITAIGESLLGYSGKPNLYEGHPHLKALFEEVQSLPGIKEWIKKRPISQF